MRIRNFHKWIRRILLIGRAIDQPEAATEPTTPDRLATITASIKASCQEHDDLACVAADRYRSAVWAIYGLFAMAALSGLFSAEVWAAVDVTIISAILVIYLVARKRDWHGEWLRERRCAETLRYLPLCATLVDFDASDTRADWYARVFATSGSGVDPDVCLALEQEARDSLRDAWKERRFVDELAASLCALLHEQEQYHLGRAKVEKALQRSVHDLTILLFALTAVAAFVEIGFHSVWLAVVTASFPTFIASLNGALAQLESLRLGSLSEVLAVELSRLEAEVRDSAAAGDALRVKELVGRSLSKLLQEHEEWHAALRPREVALG